MAEPPLSLIAGPDDRMVPARIALYFGAIFLMVGVQLPYWPLWLASRGMGPAEIGVLLAVPLWTKVIANPVVAHFADRRGERRRLMVALALGGVAAYAGFALADGFWALFALTVLVAAFVAPLMPLGETVALAAAGARGFAYGRVRLWGSLTFILAAWGGGWLLGGQPESLVLWLMLGAMALTVAACAALPETRRPRPEETAGGRAPLRRLAASPAFLLLLVTAGLIQSSHAVYYGFATIHWRAAGLSDAVIGGLWAEGVLAEIVLFAFGGGLIARLGAERLLLLAGIAGVVRWTAMGFTSELVVLVPMQVLHAFSFGAAHLAAMIFIQRRVAPSAAVTAQSLYSAIVMGAIFGLVMPFSGLLYAAIGGTAYAVMAVLAGAGGLAALALARRRAEDPIAAA